MVATSLVLVLSTPARATRHVGRFHQLVDLDVDRCHGSRLRCFRQSSVELRDGIGDRHERRYNNNEILRQLLPQKVRFIFHQAFVASNLEKFTSLLKICCHRKISHILHQLWLQGEPIAIANKKSNVPNDSEASSICDECRSEISTDAIINDHRREILPVSYGTNWMPKPNFSGYKEPIKKVSMKSLHTVAVVNDIQDSDDLSPRHSRYKRGCHTVIPNNSSDQSSGC